MIRTHAVASAIAVLCASAAMALPNNSGKQGTFSGGKGLGDGPSTGNTNNGSQGGHGVGRGPNSQRPPHNMKPGGHGVNDTPIYKLPPR